MTGASFSYDALGRRTNKTISGVSTGFLYDGVNPVQELSGATPTANLTTGLGIDEYMTRTDSAGTRSLLTDALGSTVALADNTGAMQTSYTYEPFGNAAATGTANSNSFQYTGRENDGTGLDYYRARYYSPTFSRFISEDPLNLANVLILQQANPQLDLLSLHLQRNPAMLSPYGYVGNSPMIYSDPYGLCPWCAMAAIGAGIGAASGIAGALAQGQTDWVLIVEAGLSGALVGGLTGVIPELATPGGSMLLGGLADVIGQRIGCWGKRKCDINVGSIIGSGLGAALGASSGINAVAGVASIGWGEIGQSAIGAAFGATPTTMVGLLGNAAGSYHPIRIR
jgi:RHS repeat-associated protein